MKKIIQYIIFMKKVRKLQFIYLNYFCKRIVRKDRSKIIPYKNAVVEIQKGARICMIGGDIEIGCNKIRGSKAETRLRIYQNAVWNAQNGCKISYGTTVEVLPKACLESGFFTTNSESVLIAAQRIVLGNDVMIGRNVIIYDSDYHQILDEKGNTINEPQSVIIGNHVWIGTNVLIKKGKQIGNNCIIGAGAIVSEKIEEDSICKVKYILQNKKLNGTWDRKSPQIRK